MKEEGVVPLPSRVVFTIKPDVSNPKGKEKRRLVACVNHGPANEEGDYCTAGADATSLRITLTLASSKR